MIDTTLIFAVVSSLLTISLLYIAFSDIVNISKKR